MSDVDWHAAFVHALGRAMPNAERNDFDGEGHVIIQTIDDAGERVRLRYRLSAEAEQFLNGEFPELLDGGLPIRLLVPRKDD